MAEQHSQTSDYENRWKFTGHELDRETGLYYAGARYYDPKISIWLSVDPLAEKFPSWNPYNYVMQNPIKLIDPTGMSPEVSDNASSSNYDGTEGPTDPIIGVVSAGATYNIDTKKLTLNLSWKIEMNINNEIEKAKTNASSQFDLNFNLSKGKITTDVGAKASLNASQTEGDINFKGNVESTINYNFNENKLKKDYFKSKLSVENKISDNFYNSVSTSFSVGFSVGFNGKKEFSLSGQSNFSNIPSSFNPSGGQNVTLGLNYNFKSLTTIARESFGAKYSF